LGIAELAFGPPLEQRGLLVAVLEAPRDGAVEPWCGHRDVVGGVDIAHRDRRRRSVAGGVHQQQLTIPFCHHPLDRPDGILLGHHLGELFGDSPGLLPAGVSGEPRAQLIAPGSQLGGQVWQSRLVCRRPDLRGDAIEVADPVGVLSQNLRLPGTAVGVPPCRVVGGSSPWWRFLDAQLADAGTGHVRGPQPGAHSVADLVIVSGQQDAREVGVHVGGGAHDLLDPVDDLSLCPQSLLVGRICSGGLRFGGRRRWNRGIVGDRAVVADDEAPLGGEGLGAILIAA